MNRLASATLAPALRRGVERNVSPSNEPPERALAGGPSVGLSELLQRLDGQARAHHDRSLDLGASREAAYTSERTASVASLQQGFQQRFAEAADDPAGFATLMQDSFGAAHDRGAAESIRQQTLAGDFSWMPRIEVVPDSTLADTSGTQASGRALGAYDDLGALDELTPWDSLTPDQQAEFAKLIGMAQDEQPGGVVDIDTLGRAIKEDKDLTAAPNVTQAQLDYVLEIQQRLLAGRA